MTPRTVGRVLQKIEAAGAHDDFITSQFFCAGSPTQKPIELRRGWWCERQSFVAATCHPTKHYSSVQIASLDLMSRAQSYFSLCVLTATPYWRLFGVVYAVGGNLCYESATRRKKQKQQQIVLCLLLWGRRLKSNQIIHILLYLLFTTAAIL